MCEPSLFAAFLHAAKTEEAVVGQPLAVAERFKGGQGHLLSDGGAAVTDGGLVGAPCGKRRETKG